MATEVIKKVDPTGAGDYLTLEAWAAARKGNLITRNTVEIAEVYGGGNVGGVMINAADGWVNDADHYTWVRAAAGHGHGGKFTRNKAYMHENNAVAHSVYATDVGWNRLGPGVTCESRADQPGANFSEFCMPHITNTPVGEPVIFDGVIFRRADFFWWTVSISSSTVESELIVKNCVVDANAPGNNFLGAINVYKGKGHIKVYNSLVITSGGGAGGCLGKVDPVSNWSVDSQNCYMVSIIDNTIYGAGTAPGSNDSTSNVEASNVPLRNIPYNNTTVVDPTDLSEDWHLAVGSPLIGQGVDLSAFGVTKDFEGQARSAPFDIGPDQTLSSTKKSSIFVFGL